jgi:glutamine---fructose-6-phosphate transaminase (isomerizing)
MLNLRKQLIKYMTNSNSLMRKFKHKMLKEIFEQPDVVLKNILAHLDLKKNKIIFQELDKLTDDFKKIKRFIFLGCGTSFHASLFGNYIFEQITGLPGEFELADEFNRRKNVIEPDTAFIIISQSGETAEALIAAKNIKSKKLAVPQTGRVPRCDRGDSAATVKGSLVIAITNEPNSTLFKLADINILNNAGPEKAVAATKTFTSSLALILLFALYIKQQFQLMVSVPLTGRVPGGGNSAATRKREIIAITKIVKELKLLPAKIAKVLETEKQIAEIVKKYKSAPVFIVLGENYSYPVALEIALKLKETSYIEAEGIAAGEFKHGPMALVGKDLPIIFVCLKDDYYKQNLKIIKEVKKQGGDITVISNFIDANLKKVTKNIIQVPKTENILSPLVTVISGQILAYYLSVTNGNNPDSPRHLKKFVSK